MTHDKLLADRGTARVEQLAFADFLVRGELDRHLRRMRVCYRAKRDALVAALAEELPDATVRGIAAGLHATIELPDSYDERAIRDGARDRLRDDDRLPTGCSRPPTLMLGCGAISEAAIRAGIRELAQAVRAART